MTRSEEGFTLVELMIAIFLFSILSVGFYQVMFSTVEGSNTASDVSGIAQEARLGLNRMIRDTRETTKLVTATATSYRIWADYDRDGVVDGADYEYLEYAFDGSRLTLRALTAPPAGDPNAFAGNEATLAGTTTETLAANVQKVTSTTPVFTYASNFLQYDTNANGETNQAELETGVSGAADGTFSALELSYVSDVNYAFKVSAGADCQVSPGECRTFYAQAQIRNRRYTNL